MSTQSTKQNMIIYLDIDGVLAEISHRLVHVEGPEKNYDAFYGSSMADDEPIWPNIDLVYSLIKSMKVDMSKYIDCHVVALTGRPKRTATLTKMWMEKNCPEITSFIEEWSFRGDGDYRKSPRVKEEHAVNILRKIANKVGYDNWVAVIIDDDPTNVLAIEKFLHRDFGDCEAIPITLGTKQFVKLMVPPAFGCKTCPCSSGSSHCTSSEEGCENQSSLQSQK